MSKELFDRYASQASNAYASRAGQPLLISPAPQASSVQQTSSFIISNQGSSGSRIEAREAEISADNEAYLRYASDLNNSVLLTGSSDYSKISALKSAILELRSNYFNPNNGLSVQGEKRDELDRRFLLIEHELDGLLRRRIEYSTKDYEGGSRNLDFTTLLNEKEVQIVELEKRVQNLEERLRRANAREIELENRIVALKAENLTLRDKSYTGEKLEAALKR